MYQSKTSSTRPRIRPTEGLGTRGALLLMALAAAGCGDDGIGPGERVPTSELDFVEFEETFFERVPLRDSIWAFPDRDRTLVMRTEPEAPGEDGEKFLEFRIRDGSLLRFPDGTPFVAGDSVLITVEMDPDGRFLFEFGPDGLEFSRDQPAELRIRYVLADRDLNGDGVVDERDEELEDELSIWKRERPEDGWLRLLSVEVDVDELEADVEGFTGFALAN